jgi:acylphosphatase
MSRAVEVVVTGVVQGVSFRWYAEQEGRRLGLSGWVRNEPDGTVRGHAEGEPDAVDAWVAWCHEGSPAATVERVDVGAAAVEGWRGFVTR